MSRTSHYWRKTTKWDFESRSIYMYANWIVNILKTKLETRVLGAKQSAESCRHYRVTCLDDVMLVPGCCVQRTWRQNGRAFRRTHSIVCDRTHSAIEYVFTNVPYAIVSFSSISFRRLPLLFSDYTLVSLRPLPERVQWQTTVAWGR